MSDRKCPEIIPFTALPSIKLKSIRARQLCRIHDPIQIGSES